MAGEACPIRRPIFRTSRRAAIDRETCVCRSVKRAVDLQIVHRCRTFLREPARRSHRAIPASKHRRIPGSVAHTEREAALLLERTVRTQFGRKRRTMAFAARRITQGNNRTVGKSGLTSGQRLVTRPVRLGLGLECAASLLALLPQIGDDVAAGDGIGNTDRHFYPRN